MVDPTVTKEDVDAFTGDCLRLRAIWHHYQTLFEYSQLRRELLDSVAGTFFRDINLILIGQMILQICRITDPIQMRGRTNLTVKTLIALSDFSSEPGRLEKLERLSERMHDFRKLIEPTRNRFLFGLVSRLVTRLASDGWIFGSIFKSSCTSCTSTTLIQTAISISTP